MVILNINMQEKIAPPGKEERKKVLSGVTESVKSKGNV
jgi:hypothetical protein